MLLPNADRAVIDIRKLRDYSLDSTHPKGKDKARLFAATLGMTTDGAEELREALLEASKTNDAHLGRRDSYGQRYMVDFELLWHGKRAMIRSGWIIEHGSNIPRLTTCYPL